MFDKVRATLEEKLPFPGLRRPIREWRRTRPFLAGLLVIFGGAEIILIPMVLAAEWSPIPIYLYLGLAGLVGVVIGLIMIAGGIFFWFMPSNRTFVACITAAVSVFSLVASNLGGFIVGMMAGIIGSCLAFGWTPDKSGERKPAKDKPPKQSPPPREKDTGRRKAIDDIPLNPLPWNKPKEQSAVGSGTPQWPATEPGPRQRHHQ